MADLARFTWAEGDLIFEDEKTEKAYNPRQLRWPKGTSMGGQWRSKISGRLLDRGTLTAGRTRFADNVTIRGGLFAGKETAAVKSTVRSIGGIHKVGVIPRLTIQTSGNLSSPFFGAYFIGRNRIVVAASGSHPHMTAAHEIGHFLDHKGFDKAWASANSAKLAGWRKAVESSAAIKHLREMEKGGFLRNGRFKMPVSKSVTNYYLAPREIWARSYAQYIARRSGNRSMIRELRFLQNNRLRTQWDDRDFDPIAQELDKLFRSEGWL